MNIIDIQDQLKNFSENQLVKEMQMPSGMAPQFLVLSEIQRRKRVRDDFSKREAANQQTVAQEAVAAAGVPMQGIAGMSEAMAPQSAASEGIGTIMPQSMRQAVPDAPAMPMAEGGVIYAQDGLPRGLRLSNPGNIRPGAGFFGEIGDDGGYAQFESDEAGIRAIQRLLRTYGNEYGINTLRGLANRYAPPSDNNPTGNYIDFLSQKTGFDPDQEINLAEQGSSIIPAIIGFEQGQQPFSQELIDRSIGAADLDDEDAISQALQGDNKTASSILQMLNPVSSAQASTLYPETQNEDSGMGFGQLFNEYILGPKGREVFGTETADELAAKRAEVIGQRSSEQPGERQDYQQDMQYFYSQEYQNYLRRLGLNPEKVDPNSVPDSLGTFDVMSPREHMNKFMPDPETGGSPADRFTLGMQDENVSIMEEGAEAAQSDSTTSEIDAATKERRTEVAPDTLADDDTADDKQADDDSTTKPPADLSDRTKTQSTSLEDEIKALQDKLEKGREQDKWLAIAQAGLSLMQSKEPTLLGAAGEAGISGLTAFREAQDRYQEGVVDLINARAKLKGKSENAFTINQMIQRASDLRKMAENARNAGQEGKARQLELSADTLLSNSGVIGSGAGVISGLADQ